MWFTLNVSLNQEVWVEKLKLRPHTGTKLFYISGLMLRWDWSRACLVLREKVLQIFSKNTLKEVWIPT